MILQKPSHRHTCKIIQFIERVSTGDWVMEGHQPRAAQQSKDDLILVPVAIKHDSHKYLQAMFTFCELQNDVLSILVGAWEGSSRIFSKNFHNSNATQIPLEEGSQALLHCNVVLFELSSNIFCFNSKNCSPLHRKTISTIKRLNCRLLIA